MYSLRLIYKTPFEGNIEEFVIATHIRIKDDVISFFVPQEISKEPVDFNINDLQYVFVNHYMIYTIEELVECYRADAYASDDYDNIMSIFKLIEIVFSKKEYEIFKRLSDMSIEEKKRKEHKQKKDKSTNKKSEDENSDIEIKENDTTNTTTTGEEEYLKKYNSDTKESDIHE